MTAPPIALIEQPVVIPGDPACGVVLLCDHASNHIPEEYGSLGLPPAELERHIAYDIGIAGVTRRMAEILGCPAVLSHFSRLLIDPNRGEDDPTLVMRLSDGAVVPGNARADRAEVERRLARFYRPYDNAVGRVIEEALASGNPPAVVSMHSFTPAWKGVPRPWHVTVLWDADPRLPLPLIEALAADKALLVGDNEPYDGALAGDTVNRHATARGLANALLEVRQDLIGGEEGQAEWAERIAAALLPILAEPETHRVAMHPTRTASRHRAAFAPEPSPSI